MNASKFCPSKGIPLPFAVAVTFLKSVQSTWLEKHTVHRRGRPQKIFQVGERQNFAYHFQVAHDAM